MKKNRRIHTLTRTYTQKHPRIRQKCKSAFENKYSEKVETITQKMSKKKRGAKEKKNKFTMYGV